MAPSTDYLADYAALSLRVGVVDLSQRTRLALQGQDRTAFLHSFCTNDIKRLTVGRGCEAFVTSPQGKTIGHVLVLCQAGHLLLDTSPGQAAVLTAHFDKYLISEDVQFVDQTPERGTLLVAGPEAPDLLSRLAGVSPPAEILTSALGTIAGCDVVIARVEYAGPSSYFLYASRPNLPTILNAIREAGGFPCDSDAIEARRLEAGFPLFGLDITDDYLPQEVNRDAQAISFTKGCYLGQETVARIDALGHVNRLLVGLQFDRQDVPSAGTPLQASGKEIGSVTSAAWSPRLNAALGMGCIRRQHARPGTSLESPGGPAVVVALPIP